MSIIGNSVVSKLQKRIVTLSKKKSKLIVVIREIDNEINDISNKIINYNKEDEYSSR